MLRYKFSQPAGEEAPFEKHFWSFSYPVVAENKFHWWKVFYFISGRGILFLATNKSTDHIVEQIRVYFNFFFLSVFIILNRMRLESNRPK